MNLSFTGYGCSIAIKLNRSWQLDLLDLKPVRIIEVILLIAALFWDPIFVSCLCHTIKLAFKLSLRINKIKSGVVKERIKVVLANRTVNLLDRLFRDNPE